MNARVLVLLVLGLFCVTALAGEPKLETAKQVAKALEKGIRKNDNNLIGACINRAKELTKTHEAKDLEPIAAALETAVKKNDSTRRYVALGLFEELDVPGSYKYFKALLEIPKKVTGTGTRNMYYRAINVAAKVGRSEALADIEKVLAHPDAGFSRGAARALGTYVHLEKEAKAALAQRLVKALAKAESQTGHKKDQVAKRAKGLVEELNKSLAKLTEKTGPSTADQWKDALASR